MKMPTVSYISKLIRKEREPLHRPVYKLPWTMMLTWGVKKTKNIRVTEIEFGSNSFATKINGQHHTVNEYRFNNPRDIIGLIFTEPA